MPSHPNRSVRQRNAALLGAMIFLYVLHSVSAAPPAALDGDVRTLAAAAERGSATARYKLGILYARGEKVQRNYALAAANFQQAAAQDNADAQFALAVLYDNGRGVPQDSAQAFKWYRAAAQGGNASAQYKLGVIYDRQSGTKRDVAQARLWYSRAAAQGMAAAHDALVRLAQTEVAVSPPTFAIAGTAQPVIPNLDALDRQALQLQQNLAAQYASLKRFPAATSQAYEKAEQAVTDARASAWSAQRFSRARPVLISEPLLLAMLDLEIEVRRSLGLAHTVVPNLIKAKACSGDVVADRLIYQYGLLVTNPLLPAADADQIGAVLDRFARQVACLGTEQLAWLEASVTGGFSLVALRMNYHGSGALVPAFARLAAPLQLIIFDARKHRGERSLSWQWFAYARPVLAPQIRAAGWPRGVVYLWDRRSARLVGIPACASGSYGPGCVDPLVLLNSLVDPRSVGLGDCALTGMIARGAVTVGGQSRYACPTLPCNESASDASSDRSKAMSMLSTRWPSAPRDQLLPAAGAPTQSLCRKSGDVTPQGGMPGDDQCAAELFGQNKNPWDTYAACVGIAAGVGSDTPTVFAPLAGVPMGGKACGFTDDDNGTPPPAPPPPPPDNPPDAGTPPDGTMPAPSGTPPPMPTPTPGGTPPMPSGTPDGGTPSGGGTPGAQEKPWWQRVLEVVGAILSGPVGCTSDCRGGGNKPDGGTGADAGADQRNNIQKHNDELQKAMQNSRDCVDANSCPDACTGLGSQIAQSNACTQDLMNSLLNAAGRPTRGPTTGERFPPHPYVSYYDPENAPVTTDVGGACVGGDTGPARQPSACGVMLCANTTGLLASRVGADACGCGDSSQPLRPIVANRCYAIDCLNGHNDDCSCVTDAEASGPVPRVPGGVDLGRGGAPMR